MHRSYLSEVFGCHVYGVYVTGSSFKLFFKRKKDSCEGFACIMNGDRQEITSSEPGADPGFSNRRGAKMCLHHECEIPYDRGPGPALRAMKALT